MNLKPFQPLIQPLGDGSVFLYDRITTWVSSPKYRTPEQPEPPAEKPQPAKGQQKKGDQAPDTKGEPKTPAEPEPVLDKRPPLKRVGLLLGCAYVTAVSDYTIYATAAAALGWVVAAYMVGTPDEPPTKAAHGAPAAAPEIPRDAIVQWLTEAIGDRPGIHLYELYPKMLALPGMQAHDEPTLREALVALDIPITRAFTIGDVRVRSGSAWPTWSLPSPLGKSTPSPRVKTQVRPPPLPPKSGRRVPPLPVKSPPLRPDGCPTRPRERGGEGSRTARPKPPERPPSRQDIGRPGPHPQPRDRTTIMALQTSMSIGELKKNEQSRAARDAQKVATKVPRAEVRTLSIRSATHLPHERCVERQSLSALITQGTPWRILTNHSRAPT